MDQVKFYLRQAVKYRFWITIGLANLLAIVAYFVGSGPVKVAGETKTKAVEGAFKDVQQYAGGSPPNDQYKPIVDEKKAILSTDVHKTWEKLYARQAPLLTWPEVVNERFTEWGRKYPETVDKGFVQRTINEYVVDYSDDVEAVYKTFKPFNPVDGTGVVLAPMKEALLRPAVFDESKLPSLGKVWAAKERLWIQRTLLEVVAAVNGNAKNWDGAIIKQINLLEVGNSLAQDQRSIAKGETLEEAPDLFAPGEEPTADASAAPGAAMGGEAGGMAAMYRGAAGAGGGGASESSDKVYYIKPATETNQYKILPVQMSVLCDQARVQDFLVALENSPMSIQVMDIEVLKPGQRVVKPEKGAQQSFDGYGGYAGGMMGGGGMGMMMGGGNAAMMRGSRGAGMGMGMGMSGEGGMMMGGGGMGMGGATAAPKGKAADPNSKENREKRAELAKKNQNKLQDPYYNIVEVVVYGQARFYNPPTKEEAAPVESTLGADPAADSATKTEGEPASTDAPKASEPKADEPMVDAPKSDTPKTGEPAKSDTPKPEETPKTDAPKPEEPPKS